MYHAFCTGINGETLETDCPREAHEFSMKYSPAYNKMMTDCSKRVYEEFSKHSIVRQLQND